MSLIPTTNMGYLSEADFYRLMDERKREIDRLDVSEDEREKLYGFLDDTVRRFREFDSSPRLETVFRTFIDTLTKNSK